MRVLPLFLLLVLGTGCTNDCRRLCTEWFAYLENECLVADVDSDRVNCIADYAPRLISDDDDSGSGELAECGERLAELEALRSGDGDASVCCPGSDGVGCPWTP